MSAHHRRAARRERQAAELLGTERVSRGRYESAPDQPVTLPSGIVVQAEVKTRARLPALVTKALDQAKGYGPAGSVPVAVLSAPGGELLIVLSLRSFRLIAGITDGPPADTAQIPIAFPDLGPDEARVVAAVAARLRMGARQYGPLDVDGDKRDWRHEAVEEALDLAAYLACELLRRRTST